MSEVSVFLALMATVASGTAFLSVSGSVAESPPASYASALTSIAVDARYHGQHQGIFLDAEVEGASLSFLVDTGATLTILSEKDAQAIGIQPVGTRTIKGIGGSVTARTAVMDVTINGQTIDNLEIAVVEGVPHSLLGLDALHHLGKPRLTFN
jgi:clan AA aspartic protease (TIGR02281 family)